MKAFVCCDPYGKLISPNTVTHDFHQVIKKNGMKMLRFHDLRHSCASLLLANDIPMKAIQEWLGHATFNITQIFIAIWSIMLRSLRLKPLQGFSAAKRKMLPTNTKENCAGEASKKSNSRKKKKDTPADKSQTAAV